MNTTEQVVEFALTASPLSSALEAAAEQFARFRVAREFGIGNAAPAALSALAGATTDPMWIAWISGAAAVCAADAELRWIAVCAAANARVKEEAMAVAAIAIGYEIANRLAETLGSAHTDAGWSMQATAGTIGAGAAAGRLMSLNAEQLRNALGLCATQAAGLIAVAGTAAEAVQIGKAAANAVEAALLGQCGFTSAAQSLEGRRGMFALMG